MNNPSIGSHRHDRRFLLRLLPLSGLGLAAGRLVASPIEAEQEGVTSPSSEGPRLDEHFPSQPADLVREMVGVSHGNAECVRAMLAERPALARASWDWGWGDWESALDAAAHVGNREIAELLLAHGARPTLFSAAMLGQLAVVKAAVEAQPGVQRTLGPHGITLLSHARAGGPSASAVVSFLESLGDADPRPPLVPLPAEEGARLVGGYELGPGERDRFEVTLKEGQLEIRRPGSSPRRLFHLGDWSFFPTGAPAVRLRFVAAADGGFELVLEDGASRLLARRPKL